jgi:hypothetical protein
MKKDRVFQLEAVIKQMLQPLRGVSFDLVIENLSGHKLLPFDKQHLQDQQLLESLHHVIIACGQQLRRDGLYSRRPNEVGNMIEAPVMAALTKHGLSAEVPKDKKGRRKKSGYPDIFFTDQAGRPNYLECKTYAEESLHSSLRAFYLSPSDNFKITHDARHFLLAFSMNLDGRRGQDSRFIPIAYKLTTLDQLSCNVKYEFNANNQDIYQPEAVLLAGTLE